MDTLRTLRALLCEGRTIDGIKSAITYCQSLDERLGKVPAVTLLEVLSNASAAQDNTQRRLLLFLHLCKMNRFNSNAAISMGVGYLLCLECEHVEKTKRSKVRVHLYQQLNKLHFQAAAEFLKLAKLVNLPAASEYFSQLRLSPWQWIALSVNVLIPSVKSSDWQQQLVYLFYATPSWIHPYLAKLLVYPSLIPPGACIQTPNGKAFVLHVDDNEITACNKESVFTVKSKHCEVLKDTWAGRVTMDKAIAQLEVTSPYPQAFNISRPPASLTSILLMLRDGRVEIDDLAKAIDREPGCSGFIRDSAGKSNRLNISVPSVKQAIMTYGLERLGDMLVTHALFQRLVQSNFPLREAFLQHINLCMALAAELATMSGIVIPQRASLLALVSHTAMFTNAQLKTMSVWETGQSSKSVFDNLFNQLSANHFKVAAIRLTKAWKLPAEFTATLGTIFESAKRHNHKPAMLLELAMLWSLSIKNGQFDATGADTAREQEIMDKLHLTTEDKAQCQLTASQYMFCNLPRG